jgi:DNA (cytosine-5)-methyltransferase 1
MPPIDTTSARQAGPRPLTVAGLFAGIGGIELGLHQAGHRSTFVCEIDPAARAVLDERFPGVPCEHDVRELPELPEVDVCAAGFPCQDLSQAGRTAGISGSQSSLVEHVFRLLDDATGRNADPRWLLLENVPFMLQLERGEAMRYLVRELERRDYRWAYRVVDARSFGLPQRRQRVLLVASKTEDPREVLFQTDDPASKDTTEHEAYGFYWTEGLRGLGWAPNAVPTLKGGSGLGIPSPPAVWIRSRRQLVKPDIEDAEALQGFERDWTKPAEEVARPGARWKLVGNAVSVPVGHWVGEALASPMAFAAHRETALRAGSPWPRAAWGHQGEAWAVEVSAYPVQETGPDVLDVVRSREPLSARATAGFFQRAQRSSLRFDRFHSDFLGDVAHHLEQQMSARAVAA